MAQKFNQTSIVGEVVATFPQASDLFKKHKIDFCCGGNRPLKEAIEEKQLCEPDILNELEELYQQYSQAIKMNDWRIAPSKDLVEHILNKHHEYAQSEIKQLTPYVKKIAAVHGERHPHLTDVLHLFNELKAEIAEHFAKEEETAFPAILAYETAPSDAARNALTPIVKELMDEHDHAGDILKEIRKLTNDYQLPVNACNTFKLVYDRLELLESDMFEHIHLENNILFPRYV
ncbi:regulator of cell morphogenesis and NO signaling [Bacillus ectoiniformans]|uniref:iron-sulfur cluster repair di-iron protein n=1 Tax=Bacillus ectoiniformans TaxID=1494429 RepID=UPI001958FD19|nr:iron-sulfur cluster repair di-iron protein [Bacillus ectoiniformans]MBM7649062.1 regulator of cell morphogenesis and NO signaling [Bacillus ectoiniformans]